MDLVGKAETMIRNLTRRMEREAPGMSGPIQEGLYEILTMPWPGLTPERRIPLGSTGIIESMTSLVRQFGRNVMRQQGEHGVAQALLGDVRGAEGLPPYQPSLRAGARPTSGQAACLRDERYGVGSILDSLSREISTPIRAFPMLRVRSN